jgi:hypothetical protein
MARFQVGDRVQRFGKPWGTAVDPKTLTRTQWLRAVEGKLVVRLDCCDEHFDVFDPEDTDQFVWKRQKVA